jgi:hypothetical protein
MSAFLERAKKLRPDLSDWVVHYTKGPADKAKEALREILNNGLKNHGRGICFTESPVGHFSQLFQIFQQYNEPMLSPYGVAVKKEWLFQRGGRPVIYLPEAEKQFLKGEVAHLFEEYEPGKKDFTWLREWRIKDELLQLSKPDTIVVVPTVDEAYDLAFDVKVESEYQGRGMEPLESTYMEVDWPFVTLEEIQKLEGQETSDEKMVRLLRDLMS